MPTPEEVLATLQTQKELRETQERLQLIIDHIDTITDVNNFKQLTSQNKQEVITKLKDLSFTLENLKPSDSVVNMPGYGDLNETRRKLQTVIGVLLHSLEQLHSTQTKPEPEPQTLQPQKKVTFTQIVSELDRGSSFGSHHLLYESCYVRKQILGLPPLRDTKSAVTAEGNGGKSPQVSAASSNKAEFFCSKGANSTTTSPSLLLQLKIRNQGASNEACQSWQVTTHPSQLAEAVERLIEQGLRKGSQGYSADGSLNAQKTFTMVMSATSPPSAPSTAVTTLPATRQETSVSSGKEHMIDLEKFSTSPLRDEPSASRLDDICGGSTPMQPAQGVCGGSTCVYSSSNRSSSPVMTEGLASAYISGSSSTNTTSPYTSFVSTPQDYLDSKLPKKAENHGEGFPSLGSACSVCVPAHRRGCIMRTWWLDFLLDYVIPLDVYILYVVTLLLSVIPWAWMRFCATQTVTPL